MPKFIRPEFFDIFGVGVFAVITTMSARTLFFGGPFPHWMLIFLFVIGVLGLLIDWTIVYETYLKRRASSSGVPEDPVVK